MEVVKQSFAELSKPFYLKMAEFQRSLDNATQSQDGSTVNEISKEFTSFKAFIISTLQCLQQQVDMLWKQVDASEMRSRRKMLLVHGLSEKKDEDLHATLLQLFAKHVSDNKVNENSLSKCHRLGHSKSDKPRAILLEFKEVSIRDNIWFSKSAFKGTAITISEFLTRDRHDAFVEARRRFGVSKCWTKEGIITIIGPDGSRHRAWCKRDVDAIPMQESASSVTSDDAGALTPLSKDDKPSPSQRSKRNVLKSKARKK